MAPHPSFQPPNTDLHLWHPPAGPMRKPEVQTCSRYRVKLELELELVEYQLLSYIAVFLEQTGHMSGFHLKMKKV